MQEPSTRDVVPGFAAAVRARREGLGLSLGDVAEKAGTHPTSLSKLENGVRSPSLRLAMALAGALEWSLDEMAEAAGKAARKSAKK